MSADFVIDLLLKKIRQALSFRGLDLQLQRKRFKLN